MSSGSSNQAGDIQKDDVVIIVTGQVGSGKSTFVNALLGKNRMVVGNGLKSRTRKLDYDVMAEDTHPSSVQGRVVIVDTPGFNNNSTDDTKILLNIVDWVKKKNVERIAGVLYLYDVFQDRHTSLSKPALAALRASFLSSENSGNVFERLIVVTTKWNKCADSPNGIPEGERRELELKEDIWRTLVENGTRVVRFEEPNSKEGAQQIVEALLDGEDDLDRESLMRKLRENLKKGNGRTSYLSRILGSFNFRGLFSRRSMG